MCPCHGSERQLSGKGRWSTRIRAALGSKWSLTSCEICTRLLRKARRHPRRCREGKRIRQHLHSAGFFPTLYKDTAAPRARLSNSLPFPPSNLSKHLQWIYCPRCPLRKNPNRALRSLLSETSLQS